MLSVSICHVFLRTGGDIVVEIADSHDAKLGVTSLTFDDLLSA